MAKRSAAMQMDCLFSWATLTLLRPPRGAAATQTKKVRPGRTLQDYGKAASKKSVKSPRTGESAWKKV